MDDIKIEKYVPIPTIRNKWKDTFAKMEDGDSIVLNDKQSKHSCLSNAYMQRIKVVSRKIGKDQWRVWKKGDK